MKTTTKKHKIYWEASQQGQSRELSRWHRPSGDGGGGGGVDEDHDRELGLGAPMRCGRVGSRTHEPVLACG
jgi:hypothetical protein